MMKNYYHVLFVEMKQILVTVGIQEKMVSTMYFRKSR